MSHLNCIFPMNRYVADKTVSACETCLTPKTACGNSCHKNYYERFDKTTPCSVCGLTESSGTDYWFQGAMFRICDKHDVVKVLSKSQLEAKELRLCPGNCPDGSVKCIWPISKTATAASIISKE